MALMDGKQATFPFGSINCIRFQGYDLSPDTQSGTPLKYKTKLGNIREFQKNVLKDIKTMGAENPFRITCTHALFLIYFHRPSDGKSLCKAKNNLKPIRYGLFLRVKGGLCAVISGFHHHGFRPVHYRLKGLA